ncbi:MAG: DUF3309 family protein [Proteobacteria bacterium]|nr:DUF3309 family protein [Pseudomonadota bacterium]
MLGTILLAILALALIGALPYWGWSRDWGLGPSGLAGIMIVMIVLLWALGRV